MRGLVILILLPLVTAHSNILYDVELDFDERLKGGVIKAAQEFLNTKESPVQFDYDKELILAKFSSDLEYYVIINPLDFSVHGFRDDRLLSRDASETINADRRKELAKEVFDSLPVEKTQELVYGEESQTYAGSYVLRWYRFVNSIYVSGEYFEVEIDSSDGDIIAWKLSLRWNSVDEIKSNPSFSGGVAKKIAELTFNAEPLEFTPLLIINKDSPLWIVKVKKLYPIFVGIDAEDGMVLFTGNLRDEIPEGYAIGTDIPVIKTALMKSIIGDTA